MALRVGGRWRAPVGCCAPHSRLALTPCRKWDTRMSGPQVSAFRASIHTGRSACSSLARERTTPSASVVCRHGGRGSLRQPTPDVGETYSGSWTWLAMMNPFWLPVVGRPSLYFLFFFGRPYTVDRSSPRLLFFFFCFENTNQPNKRSLDHGVVSI